MDFEDQIRKRNKVLQNGVSNEVTPPPITIGELNKAIADQIQFLTTTEDTLLKGRAVAIGTIAKRPNGMFIKTANGWKYHSSHGAHAAANQPSAGGGARQVSAPPTQQPSEPLPTTAEYKASIDAVVRALSENKGPDVVTALRDKVKQIGMAHEVPVAVIDREISAAYQAHKDKVAKTDATKPTTKSTDPQQKSWDKLETFKAGFRDSSVPGSQFKTGELVKYLGKPAIIASTTKQPSDREVQYSVKYIADNGTVTAASNVKDSELITKTKTTSTASTFKSSPKFAALRESDAPKSFVPKGQWTVERNFRVSPGGGWGMSFNAGTLVKSDGNGKIESSVDGGITWKHRKPPISDTNELNFNHYANNPERRNMYNAFANALK